MTFETVLSALRSGTSIATSELAAAMVAFAAVESASRFQACHLEVERLVGLVRLDCVRGVEGVAMLRAAREANGWLGAVRAASVLGWTDAWGAAMTAHFGPTGLHVSRCDEEGRPTAETLAKFPHVAFDMRSAEERFESLLGWYTRHGGTTRWEDVIAPKRAA